MLGISVSCGLCWSSLSVANSILTRRRRRRIQISKRDFRHMSWLEVSVCWRICWQISSFHQIYYFSPRARDQFGTASLIRDATVLYNRVQIALLCSMMTIVLMVMRVMMIFVHVTRLLLQVSVDGLLRLIYDEPFFSGWNELLRVLLRNLTLSPLAMKSGSVSKTGSTISFMMDVGLNDCCLRIDFCLDWWCDGPGPELALSACMDGSITFWCTALRFGLYSILFIGFGARPGTTTGCLLAEYCGA